MKSSTFLVNHAFPAVAIVVCRLLKPPSQARWPVREKLSKVGFREIPQGLPIHGLECQKRFMMLLQSMAEHAGIHLAPVSRIECDALPVAEPRRKFKQPL